MKWVLSRGGRFYKVGDFKKLMENGLMLTKNDGVMNFGKDSYAAMTYYVQDFGTQENQRFQRLLKEIG